MKAFPIIIACFLFISSCSDAPKIKKEPAGRIVLAEFFTFARCIFCPYAEEGLDSLSKEFGDSLAIIAYHRRVLGDTLSPAYTAVRESLYTIQTSPIVVFDGLHKVQTEKPEDDYPTYKNYILSERGRTTPLKLSIESNVNLYSVHLKITIIPVDSLGSGDFRLFLVLTEDSVYFRQIGAPDSIFYFVARRMIPDEQGIPVNPVYPDSIVKEIDFNLQSNWQINKLGIVGFVQDMETKEVLQAYLVKRIEIHQ
uniref:Omp28-related outer membrane protein n=1 Tax=candidate division WOR-3 bacterium TaxID=2052148 RepID=A0A7C4TCU6_UNCW3